MVSFDATTLNAQAARVSASAAMVSDLQAQLCQLATSISWQSPAAHTFADALGALLAQSEAGRRLSLDLAEAVRRHAQVATRRAEDLNRAGAVVGAVVGKLEQLI